MVNDNEPEFLFFFSSGLWTASSARGDGVMVVEPEIVSEALKKTWRREAICLSVQVFNILLGLYTIYLSFDSHSAII